MTCTRKLPSRKLPHSTAIDSLKASVPTVPFQVREHLLFFGKLKGASEGAINEEAEELVRKFELEPKLDVLSRNLSGGMKRKLSMANAMVGGSSVIVLDQHAKETYALVPFVAAARQSGSFSQSPTFF